MLQSNGLMKSNELCLKEIQTESLKILKDLGKLKASTEGGFIHSFYGCLI